MSENQEPSLTQEEAAERAALVEIERYDITVDLTGLLEGDLLTAESRITFRCREPGAASFVDCLADVEEATLNGRPLDLADAGSGRLGLPDLAADNVLVVRSSTTRTSQGAGVLRTVDPSDKLVYVWTSFEPDDARRVWACFDQPDLKAPHGFVVTAPESWTVTSNSAPERVDPGDGAERIWTFPDTPPLSTYVVVVNAGPFHEVRDRRGDHDLGLFCRQSLARYLDRDAEELLDLTDRGLRWFGERFARPFGQERYDQVFVPNMGGAMENWGCVTWTDAVLYRSTPTYDEREMRASVLMHEMAHMWFGDLVTMRWWDDLWLNEAFASWAATWALAGATEEFADAPAVFLATGKQVAYRQDAGPATHPIQNAVPDVAHAMANFDAITYMKGQSVLGQLAAYVGEEAFVAGLASYFERHAWSNTRLVDLITAVSEASGRDLGEWTTAWLDRAGTDTITMSHPGGPLLVSGPDGGPPRPHRLDVAGLALADGALSTLATVEVETPGGGSDPEARADTAIDGAHAYLLNAGDLTFASVRTDAESQRLLLDHAETLTSVLDRASVLTTANDLMLHGELAPHVLVETLLRVLRVEPSPALLEPFLRLAANTAEVWAPPERSAALLAGLADVATGLLQKPDVVSVARRTLAASATEEEQFALLADAAADEPDLQWRILARRAELGDLDEDAVSALEERDPDPEAWVRRLGVLAAAPDGAAKEEVWRAVMVDREVPAGRGMFTLGQLFWRPTQADLLRPYTGRYLEVLADLGHGGLLSAGSIVRAMFPTSVGDAAFCDLADDHLARGVLAPAIRGDVAFGVDTLRRILAARSMA